MVCFTVLLLLHHWLFSAETFAADFFVETNIHIEFTKELYLDLNKTPQVHQLSELFFTDRNNE